MNQLILLIGNAFRRYTFGQRVVLVIVFLGIISAIAALVMWANRPEYTVLYSNLDPSVAGKVVGELRGRKIRYQVENNGRTIYVPVDKVTELRLQFAEAGYAGSTVQGYEIFDNAKIGMTSFMQHLNMRRALEGELTKTINQFPGVKNSRVHLVFPENKLFENKKRGSASVVLYMNPNMYLRPDQVQGIVAVVANSADGIEPEDVVVVDSKGTVLSQGYDEKNALGAAGNQWDLRHAIESRLMMKVLDLVEGVVGRQKAVVEVSVDLDFQRIERTSEYYDPENVVVVSEERHLESSKNRDSTANANEDYSKENVITNYELNKTMEHFASNTGTIKQLSVAVLVDGEYQVKTNSDGEEIKEYKPRSNKELNQIASLVKSAVGYNADRGDVVEIQNLQFNRTGYEEEQEYFAAAEKQAFWAGIMNKGFMVVGFIVAFLLLKAIMKSAGPIFQLSTQPAPPLPQNSNAQLPTQTEENEIPEDIYIKKLSPEARARLKAKDKMTKDVMNYSKENPEGAAKLIRSWLTEQNQA